MTDLATKLAQVRWVNGVWTKKVQSALDQAQSLRSGCIWEKKPSVNRIKKIYFSDGDEAYLEEYASAVILRERVKKLYFGKNDPCGKEHIRTLITSDDRREAKKCFQTLTKISEIPALKLFSGCSKILEELAGDYEAIAKGKLPPKWENNFIRKLPSSLIPPVKRRAEKTQKLYRYLKSCLRNNASTRPYADKTTATSAQLDKLASSIDGLLSPQQIKKMILDRS